MKPLFRLLPIILIPLLIGCASSGNPNAEGSLPSCRSDPTELVKLYRNGAEAVEALENEICEYYRAAEVFRGISDADGAVAASNSISNERLAEIHNRFVEMLDKLSDQDRDAITAPQSGLGDRLAAAEEEMNAARDTFWANYPDLAQVFVEASSLSLEEYRSKIKARTAENPD